MIHADWMLLIAASLANIHEHIRAQGAPHWALVAVGYSMKSKEGKAFYESVIKTHPKLHCMSVEEVQREITDQVSKLHAVRCKLHMSSSVVPYMSRLLTCVMFGQILAVILDGHDTLSKQVSTATDPQGRTVSVVPILAGVIGDNMEIQRWLHGKSNTCHVCTRGKHQLGCPGFLSTDVLKSSEDMRASLGFIASSVLNDDHTYKSGQKTRAKDSCAALGVHPSALHPAMAPILRIKHFNAYQQVKMHLQIVLIHIGVHLQIVCIRMFNDSFFLYSLPRIPCTHYPLASQDT